ncbi:hypothetical protein JCM12214_14980 [Geobacillus vulcani]
MDEVKERLAAPGKRQHDSEKQEKHAKAGPAFLFAAAGEKSERDEEKKHVHAAGPGRKCTRKEQLNAKSE